MARRSVEVRYEAITRAYDGKVIASSTLTRKFAGDIESADNQLGLFGRKADSTGSQIDRLSGRVRLLAEGFAVLGPSLIPIGAVGIPAISGLASQLGIAAVAGGTVILAVQGVSDALKAVRKAELEPTTDNLNAARVALDRLSPSARQFVTEIRDMTPELTHLRDIAAEGLFSGVNTGLADLEKDLPRVERLIGSVSTEVGNIVADTANSLTSDRWTPFLDFLGREAPAVLRDTVDAAGSTVHALAALWMAFTPLNDDFSSWLVDATNDLDRWASHLDQTQGFHDFIAFVEEEGPQVADTFGAIANAAIQIVEAASPLSGPVLKGIEVVSDLVGDIADSDLGSPILAGVSAVLLYNRAVLTTQKIQASTFGQGAVNQFRSFHTGLTAAENELRTANVALEQARARSAAASLAARDAQFGLIPASSKRKAIYDYTAALSAQEEAEKRVTNAVVQRGVRIRETTERLGKATVLMGTFAAVTTGASDKVGLTNTASLALAGTMSGAGALGTALGAAAGLTLDLAHANDSAEDSIKRAKLAVEAQSRAQIVASRNELQARAEELASGHGFLDNFRRISALISGTNDDLLTQTHELDAAQQDLVNGHQGIAHLLTQGLGRSMRQTASDIDGAADALTGFLEQLDTFEGRLNKEQAALNLRNSLRDLRKTLVENPLGNKLATGLTTKAGVQGDAVRQALLNTIKDAQVVLSRFQGDRFVRGVRQARSNILGIAEAFHVPRVEVDRMLEQFGIIDKTKIEPKVNGKTPEEGVKRVRTLFDELTHGKHAITVDADTVIARRQARDLRRYVRELTGLDVKVSADTRPAKKQINALAGYVKNLLAGDFAALSLVGTSATGGLYQSHAQGDIANGHMPELAGPGLTRIWREPETRGEAYIPLADDFRRPRAVDIWEKTGVALGVQFQRYANGGITAGGGGQQVRLSAGDIDRLASAMLNARPMYGDVLMQPHNYSQFQREMAADRSRASRDSIPRR